MVFSSNTNIVFIIALNCRVFFYIQVNILQFRSTYSYSILAFCQLKGRYNIIISRETGMVFSLKCSRVCANLFFRYFLLVLHHSVFALGRTEYMSSTGIVRFFYLVSSFICFFHVKCWSNKTPKSLIVFCLRIS